MAFMAPCSDASEKPFLTPLLLELQCNLVMYCFQGMGDWVALALTSITGAEQATWGPVRGAVLGNLLYSEPTKKRRGGPSRSLRVTVTVLDSSRAADSRGVRAPLRWFPFSYSRALGWVSLGAYAAGSDEPGPEGLTSTSLLDLLLPTGLEPLDSEEPSEAMGLGAGLGAPGSGFPSEESEESRILQPPQYFWEEEEELNDSSLDLGPTADYGFPDLTEKAGPIEDSQGQEASSLPPPLPKMNLVEPPWHMAPGEEEEEEDEEKEEEKEDIEKEEEEEEKEELLPVNRAQEEAQTQVHDFSTTSSSQTPLAPKHKHEDSGDQASSGVEVGSSMEPSLSPPSVTPSTVTLGGQDFTNQEAGDTTLPAAGHEVDFEAPQEATEEATMGITVLAGKQGEVLSLASFPQAEAPSGAETPDEDPLYPGASATVPLPSQDMELTPSSATLGQEDLSQQPQERQAAEAQSRIPWDSTQVVCKDWSNLAGKNYIILNMTENIDCEVFRQHWGLQFLALVEEVLPRHGSGHHGDWHISLSKPSEKEQHLLMTLVGEQGVMPTQDVLSMLGDIRRSLVEIGIQNYSTTSSCQARASQVRSDYGTLFVVLVVIGAICVIIIVLGLLYNCWQRRLPKLKHVVSVGAGGAEVVGWGQCWWRWECPAGCHLQTLSSQVGW
ncbi:PREDICTED: podocalyxin-like protein 2 [Myotis brandtii]|uniref:podocalyxin-like protein 2 n=1 Tax=Myotis brandtii TaxID=109478 RepID=UPI0007046A87|nr:PREDICTED: podocalyxin-like protein 2 [Myotis brandtii]